MMKLSKFINTFLLGIIFFSTLLTFFISIYFQYLNFENDKKQIKNDFLELQKNGVRIVFSTHSLYMADYLNALVKKRKLEDKVSFNLLTEKDGVVENIILNDGNWNLLQKELLSALEDIMWEYL